MWNTRAGCRGKYRCNRVGHGFLSKGNKKPTTAKNGAIQTRQNQGIGDRDCYAGLQYRDFSRENSG